MLRRVLSLVFWLWSALGSAATLAQPLHTPLAGPFIASPGPRSPLALGGCELGLNLAVANSLSAAEGAWGSLYLDSEEWEARFSLRQSLLLGHISEQKPLVLELGSEIPIKAIWGGVFDAPLDEFHKLLRVGHNTVQNRVLIDIKRTDGGQQWLQTQNVFGLGDPMVYLGLSTPLAEGVLEGRLSLQWPLGQRELLLGAGVPLSGLYLAWNSPTWGLDASGTWLWQPTSAFGRSVRPTLGARAWFQTNWSWLPAVLRGFTIEVSGATSPLGDLGRFSNPSLALRIGYLGVFFSEDLLPTLPDVVLDGRIRSPCPW
jgi:hypothetical protein